MAHPRATPDAPLPDGWPRWPLGTSPSRRGYRTSIRIEGAPQPATRRWPAGTRYKTIEHWIQDTRAVARLTAGGAEIRLPDGADGEPTLRTDIRARYLPAVATMPTLKWRIADLALWCERPVPPGFVPAGLEPGPGQAPPLIGDLPRRLISAALIRAVLADWRAVYAVSTVNHRRTALMHVWSILDPGQPCPVRLIKRETDHSAERAPAPLSPGTVRAVLARMRPSATKARVQLMAWAGLPQEQMMALDPDQDLDHAGRRVFLGRNKGQGTAGRWIPFTGRGWAAVRIFLQFKAYGRFSTSSLRKSFRLAAAKVVADPTIPRAVRAELADVTPYALRHSFLTLVALRTGDDRVVAFLGLHSDVRMVKRYTRAATDPRVLAALIAVETAVKTDRKTARMLPIAEFLLPTTGKSE